MTFGLPVHLAPLSQSTSFGRALHATGLVCLAGAALLAIAFGLPWPALILLPVMVVLLGLLDRRRSTIASLAYLAVGAATVYGYTLQFATAVDLAALTDAFTIAPVKVALVMVGGAGVGAVAGLRWCTAGFLLAEAASAVALAQSGTALFFDQFTALAFLSTAAILLLSWYAAERAKRTTPMLHRAAVDHLMSVMRRRVQVRAAAVTHDTVLSDLAAIALSPAGPMTAALRAQLERSASLIATAELLTDAPTPADQRAGWLGSPLYAAVTEAQALGLDVDVTGDRAASLALEPHRAVALGLAVKQCLVNVIQHSETMDAEVAIHGAAGELLVMVIDTGRGFDGTDVASDRLGLSGSVRARIEDVDGSVRIWSTPGRGTSVVIRLPLAESARSDAPARNEGGR